jgi:hypothetical protein
MGKNTQAEQIEQIEPQQQPSRDAGYQNEVNEL